MSTDAVEMRQQKACHKCLRVCLVREILFHPNDGRFSLQSAYNVLAIKTIAGVVRDGLDIMNERTDGRKDRQPVWRSHAKTRNQCLVVRVCV